VTRDQHPTSSDAMRNQEQRRLALTTLARSSTTARAFTQETLAQWSLADLTDDALLVVGELVSNAVLHATGPITLVLDLREQGVCVEVIDDSPAMPSTRTLSDTRTNGRGLAIVAAVAREWGVQRLSTGGKSVWAAINRPSPLVS
jgi:anti-sigma regulatory factor (Ser/Thr protein kinase)